jgi:hypothetical protein
LRASEARDVVFAAFVSLSLVIVFDYQDGSRAVRMTSR